MSKRFRGTEECLVSTPPRKMRKGARSHEENQERAYVAASRRTDRSIEARVQSARMASAIHKKRTGRGLKISEEAVLKEEMYEEEEDDHTVLPYLRRQSRDHIPNTISRQDEVDRMFAEQFPNVPMILMHLAHSVFSRPLDIYPSTSLVGVVPSAERSPDLTLLPPTMASTLTTVSPSMPQGLSAGTSGQPSMESGSPSPVLTPTSGDSPSGSTPSSPEEGQVPLMAFSSPLFSSIQPLDPVGRFSDILEPLEDSNDHYDLAQSRMVCATLLEQDLSNTASSDRKCVLDSIDQDTILDSWLVPDVWVDHTG